MRTIARLEFRENGWDGIEPSVEGGCRGQTRCGVSLPPAADLLTDLSTSGGWQELHPLTSSSSLFLLWNSCPPSPSNPSASHPSTRRTFLAFTTVVHPCIRVQYQFILSTEMCCRGCVLSDWHHLKFYSSWLPRQQSLAFECRETDVDAIEDLNCMIKASCSRSTHWCDLEYFSQASEYYYHEIGGAWPGIHTGVRWNVAGFLVWSQLPWLLRFVESLHRKPLRMDRSHCQAEFQTSCKDATVVWKWTPTSCCTHCNNFVFGMMAAGGCECREGFWCGWNSTRFWWEQGA